jgi:hypothetical protein
MMKQFFFCTLELPLSSIFDITRLLTKIPGGTTQMSLKKQTRITTFSLALALVCITAPRPALARAGQSDTDEKAAATQECKPPCRAGFACADGICVNPCNPPCASGKVCSRSGQCIPAAPLVLPTPATSYSGQLASPGYGMQHSPVFDQGLYNKYQRKRGAGGALMVVGLLMVFGAIGMGVGAGLDENEILLYSGIGVELLGNIFFFSGLAAWIKGKVGMARMEKMRLGRLEPDHPRTGLASLTPPSSQSPTASGRGLSLSFAF